MQQPMSQHDQIAAQQAQQQMVLCPVRLVYETQILVQPGEQIQPNQTLFINPQNPPPWAQNRQVQQNPVIYVQQLSNNIMPTVQQHMDQQHLYLQQYQNFQQIVPQQMIQNAQDNRQNQIQIQNLIHQNMLANYQTNIGQNMQLQDRGIQQVNFAQTHSNVGANIQMQNQAQIGLANSNTIRQNETMSNAIQVPQQNQTNQRVEVKQTYQHSNVGQITQPQHMARPQPQVLTVNPIQNLPQTINVQTFSPNIINRPIKTENASSQASMPTFVNAAQNTHITRIRKVAPAANMNKINTPNIGIRNMSQPYRPIQPRTHYRHQFPRYPVETQTQSTQSMPMIHQNIVNINSNIPGNKPVVSNIPSNQPVGPNIQMQPQNIIKPEENNRKRKSESPDEIHKKMAAIQVNNNVPMKQINIVQSTETGTNTSPIQKKEVKLSMPILFQTGTNTSPIHKKGEKLSMPILFHNEKPPETTNMNTLIQNVQNAIKVDKVNMIKPNENPKDSTQSNVADKDKLKRNTVYTQARGRVLTEKELHNSTSLSIATIMPKEDKPLTNDVIKTETDKTFKMPNPVANEKVTDVVKAETDKPFKITNVVKSEKDLDENKVETKEREMNVSLNTTNNKGMFPMEKCEQEKDYILTHVLDGIVIQESNTAFPIREPLTRRSVHQTQFNNEKRTRKENKIKEKQQEEAKMEQEKEISPVINNTSDEDKKVLEEVTQEDSESPFSNITPATLKSWTTSELSAHLTKHKWDEPAALFQEHEIDGESLFLVSKSQLQTIGIKEAQAEVICAFVKS